MILSSACCTPSPETSRIIEGVVGFAGNLVDLVDVDDAALGTLDVVVTRLQQLEDDVLDVLADVASFGERRRIGDGEGTSRTRASVCANNVLPEPVGPIKRIFDFASSTSLCEKTSTPPVRHCPQKSAPHYRVGHLGTGSNLLDRAERSSPEAA